MPRWPFTASRWQVTTYLLGVALFSISFLVFLNSSVSFVITNLIGQKQNVGDAVGSLGFADELVALVACPLWGILSDRVGVRTVCAAGYAVIAISLCVFVQAKNVYPQLLLARLFFSIGGAATSTMVTAILPAMTAERGVPTIRIVPDVDIADEAAPSPPPPPPRHIRHRPSGSTSTIATEATLTPGNWRSVSEERRARDIDKTATTTSRTAGLVGMFTGIGALIALGAFLPLPAWLEKSGQSPAASVQYSFYIVAAVALVVAVFCSVGLRWLPGEESKGWRTLLGNLKASDAGRVSNMAGDQAMSYSKLLKESVRLALTDPAIGLGCVGGFVARASSVGISLFIPLFVNAYFVSSGLCNDDPHSDPSEIKRQCQRAYTLAAALTGVSQLVALLAAPLVGYLDGKYRRMNGPLIAGAAIGVVGYVGLANTSTPEPKKGGGIIFLTMALVGISQISAIVCSLSVLGRGLQTRVSTEQQSALLPVDGAEVEESSPLLGPERVPAAELFPRNKLKGSIAGLYSLVGGAGILLLTKLGGYLFDKVSPGAPFYMMALFNAILLAVASMITARSLLGSRLGQLRSAGPPFA